MWELIKETLVNLDNVTEISHSGYDIEVNYIGSENARLFTFDSEGEQNNKFIKLMVLLLGEE